jgi:steroid 5-alpha reductase family enzyme
MKRIRKHGSDSRFDDIKPHPLQFFGAWMAQATWISMTALPVFAINSLPAKLHPAFGIRDYIGLALWCVGVLEFERGMNRRRVAAFIFEVTADRQKSQWREEKNNKQHDEKYDLGTTP